MATAILRLTPVASLKKKGKREWGDQRRRYNSQIRSRSSSSSSGGGLLPYPRRRPAARGGGSGGGGGSSLSSSSSQLQLNFSARGTRQSGATSGDTAATDQRAVPVSPALREDAFQLTVRKQPPAVVLNGATSPWTVSVFEAGLTGVGVAGVGDEEGVSEEASRGSRPLGGGAGSGFGSSQSWREPSPPRKSCILNVAVCPGCH